MINLTKQINRKWLLFIPAMLLAAILAVLFQQEAGSLPEEDGTLVYWETDEELGVSYGYGVDNLAHEANAQIEYDFNSETGINNYRTFSNRELTRILQGKGAEDVIPLLITFNTPLTKEQFSSFVEKHKVTVIKYTMWALEPSGLMATIEGSPGENGQLVPDAEFAMATSGVAEASGPGTQFLGWVDVSVTVEVKQIQDINQDSWVFLADAGQTMLEAILTNSKLREAHIANNIRKDVLEAGFTAIYRIPLGWARYEQGLMEVGTPK